MPRSYYLFLFCLTLFPLSYINANYQNTQISIALNPGWNWLSINVSNIDMSIGLVLGSLTPSEGDYIKNQSASATWYDGFGWFGDLSTIDPKEMYKIRLAEADILIFEGTPADCKPVNINIGWSWIGYLPQSSLPIDQALASITPLPLDYIKSKTASSTFYDSFGWFGELTHLDPHEGYMLYTSHTETLVYPGCTPELSDFTDSRDDKTYTYLTLGTQNWMAENLAYLPSVKPSAEGSSSIPYYYVNGYEGSHLISAMATNNYTDYGALYNWTAAVNACPDGWFLPNHQDWSVLLNWLTDNGHGYEGSGSDIAKSMASPISWLSSSNLGAVGNEQVSNNKSGFNALAGGSRDHSAVFNIPGSSGYFWSSTPGSSSSAWRPGLDFDSGSIDQSLVDRSNGFSVRCMQDNGTIDPGPTAFLDVSPESGTTESTYTFDASGCTDIKTISRMLTVRWDWDDDGEWDTGYSPTKTETHYYSKKGIHTIRLEVLDNDGLTDITSRSVSVTTKEPDGSFIDARDGNEYSYVTLGSLTWMAENLAYLPSVGPSNQGSQENPYHYVYDFQGTSISAAKSTPNYSTYGVLYNWPAALAACPQGWHLPTDDEWTVLKDWLVENDYGYRRIGADIGKAMASRSHWMHSGQVGDTGNDLESNNRSGFNAFPAGMTYPELTFKDLESYAFFWTSTPANPPYIRYRRLLYLNGALYSAGNKPAHGYSVRCVKDY